jgi:cytosine/creatinine deaminase
VTVNGAEVMHLKSYGLEMGCDAALYCCRLGDKTKAIRLRANRLRVWKKGLLLAETAEVLARLKLANRPNGVVFSHP